MTKKKAVKGVAMLSSVLRSKCAVQVNIQIMRTFEKPARKLTALEKKYDDQFKIVFEAIRELMIAPEPKKKKQIGFILDKEN